jgi:hypothetical protein
MVQGKTELTLAANSVILVELATQFADALTAIRAVGLWGGLLKTFGSLMAGSCKAGIDICSKEAMQQAHAHCLHRPSQRVSPCRKYGNRGPSCQGDSA